MGAMILSIKMQEPRRGAMILARVTNNNGNPGEVL